MLKYLRVYFSLVFLLSDCISTYLVGHMGIMYLLERFRHFPRHFLCIAFKLHCMCFYILINSCNSDCYFYIIYFNGWKHLSHCGWFYHLCRYQSGLVFQILLYQIYFCFYFVICRWRICIGELSNRFRMFLHLVFNYSSCFWFSWNGFSASDLLVNLSSLSILSWLFVYLSVGL